MSTKLISPVTLLVAVYRIELQFLDYESNELTFIRHRTKSKQAVQILNTLYV